MILDDFGKTIQDFRDFFLRRIFDLFWDRYGPGPMGPGPWAPAWAREAAVAADWKREVWGAEPPHPFLLHFSE